uniref:Uncharacterized protein n=1 Tax=Romanomermis culicivorax TaxID=13658 RepID=A0A915K1D4_ROMCU
MDEKSSDTSGNFHLEGATSEFTDIDPMLKIYHNCIDDGPLTIRKRRWRFELPKKYICKGQTCRPTILDVGSLNLEPKILEEDRNF